MFLRSLTAALLFTFSLATVCSAQVITNSTADVQLVTSDSYLEVVPAGSSQQIAFTADPVASGGDTFHVISSIPNATISLIIPGGTEITSANAQALGYSYVSFLNDDPEGSLPSSIDEKGTHTFISIPASSVRGTYSIKVVAPAGPEDTVVVATYFSSSVVRIGLIAESQWYRVGQTVVFTALVFNGSTPVNNASVTLAVDDVIDDTIAPVNITLQDSGPHDLATGDGIYTGTFTPTRAGEYAAGVRVSGAAPAGVNFKRLAGTRFRVQPPLATFVSFSDQGIDDDGDEILDRIVINTNVSVQRAGLYQLGVSLVGSNGKVIKSELSANLATGSQQLSVSFSAAAVVLQLGVDGPYAIKDAMLTFHSDPEVLVADYRAIVGNTAAYPLPSLNPAALAFLSNRTATGVDTNANGKFDILRVRAQVFARFEGFYEWSGRLLDSAGNEIAFASSTGNFATGGSNFATFDFDGSLIGQHGVNGPYSVRSVILFGENQSIIVDQLMDTPAFSFKEFENSDNLRIVTVNAQETSGDADGFIEPSESGSLSVRLRNVGGSSISGINATLSSLTPGVTINSAQSAYATLPASGEATNSGPFTFTVSSTVPCGQLALFKLTINHDGDGGIPSVVNFSIQIGRPATAASTFTYSGPAVPIPDFDRFGVRIPITVSGVSGALRDLNFRFGGSVCTAAAGATTVGLDHTFVGDLVIRLTSPSGTTVRLLNNPGANNIASSGNNFCNLTLDDEGGGSSIQNILPGGEPYTGTFLPESPLAAFRGEDPNGTWTLTVVDFASIDTGNVRNFSLILSGSECSAPPPPAQNKVLFNSERDGNYELYAINDDGSNQTRITNTSTTDEYRAVFSPNGQKIAFAVDQDGSNTWDIFVMNANGTNRVNLTHNADFEYGFNWSPDSTKIAFESGSTTSSALFVMNADGTGKTQLITTGGSHVPPAWSPDGSKIAFVSYVNTVAGRPDIFVIGSDGSNPTNLTQTDWVEGTPVWSPDGSKILFSKRHWAINNSDLYVMNANGSGLQRLTTIGGVGTYKWSPDGTKIVFTSNFDGDEEVYVMNADGSNQVDISLSEGLDYAPTWSSDGLRILFRSYRDGDGEVYMMNADGSGQVNLTNNPAFDALSDSKEPIKPEQPVEPLGPELLASAATVRRPKLQFLSWWREVLIPNQPARYFDDRQADKYWLVSFRK